MSNNEIETEEVKVVLLGESGVGKTSILKQYIIKTFNENNESSISGKFITKTLELKDINKKIKFNLWDTAGQEKYRALAKIFYKDAGIIIFVYSITSKSSLNDIRNYWYEEIKARGLSNSILAVVGNKNDLYNNSQVSEEEAREWADSIKAIFQLTSAKTNSGIDLLFENLARKYFNPDFDYKSMEEEQKKLYEKKKKENEEKKKKEKEKEDDDNDDVKIQEINRISLDSNHILDEKSSGSLKSVKKKKCC